MADPAQNETVRLGAVWTFTLNCTVDGAALDLTGAAVQFRVASDRALALDLSVGGGITVPDPASGVALIAVTKEMQTTAGVRAGVYAYEARVTPAGGQPIDQAYGSLTVRDSLFVKYA